MADLHSHQQDSALMFACAILAACQLHVKLRERCHSKLTMAKDFSESSLVMIKALGICVHSASFELPEAASQ